MNSSAETKDVLAALHEALAVKDGSDELHELIEQLKMLHGSRRLLRKDIADLRGIGSWRNDKFRYLARVRSERPGRLTEDENRGARADLVPVVEQGGPSDRLAVDVCTVRGIQIVDKPLAIIGRQLSVPSRNGTIGKR